jgi:hypothetical protein
VRKQFSRLVSVAFLATAGYMLSSCTGQAITNAPGLTDYMRALVGSDEGIETQWDANGLAIAFNELANGRLVDISGASGTLTFDMETRTKVLNTTYMIWRLDLESVLYGSGPYLRVLPLLYVSTEGDFGEASTTSIWQFEKTMKQIFNEGHEDHRLPAVGERWAVVVSPSTKWDDYRHQADAFASTATTTTISSSSSRTTLPLRQRTGTSPARSSSSGVQTTANGACSSMRTSGRMPWLTITSAISDGKTLPTS